jgi:hypothetical protein
MGRMTGKGELGGLKERLTNWAELTIPWMVLRE